MGAKNALCHISVKHCCERGPDKRFEHDADDRYADRNDVGNGPPLAPHHHFPRSWDRGLYQVSPLLRKRRTIGAQHLVPEQGAKLAESVCV